jgi:hypothetical protein
MARAGFNALARERDPWGRAMGSLIRAGLLSLEDGGPTREILHAAVDELAGVNLGLYAMLCGALAREDGAPWLISCGIQKPSALARMLLPGLYSGQFT